MSAAVPYSVPEERGAVPAALLAVLVHAALLAFLWFGVSWQNQTPVAIEAEVWNFQPVEAAPPPPPPQPEPKPVAQETPKPVEPPMEKPDIALEQEKKRKEQAQREEQQREQQRAQEEARQKAEAEAQRKKELADKAAQEKIRQAAIRRMMAQADAGRGDAPRTQGPRGDPDYAARIAAKIRSNTVFPPPPGLTGNPEVEYAVDLLPDGSLRRVRLLRSSGMPSFDAAVSKAIELSQPFPADKSGKVPREVIVDHKLKEE